MEELLMEERFLRFVQWIADRIDRGAEHEFDLEMFEKYFPHIKNKEMLERCVDEENEAGYSECWDLVEFEPSA